VARYRLSAAAQADIAKALRESQAEHGAAARARYRGLLSATLRRAAAEPEGPLTRDRAEVAPGLRSLHSRHCRRESREEPVRAPAHVIFFRPVEPGLIEIVRVLHERMEPSRWLR
jgi:toxin ParE1/3/4